MGQKREKMQCRRKVPSFRTSKGKKCSTYTNSSATVPTTSGCYSSSFSSVFIFTHSARRLSPPPFAKLFWLACHLCTNFGKFCRKTERSTVLFNLAQNGGAEEMRGIFDQISPTRLTQFLAETKNGFNLLNLAADSNNLEVTSLLLEKGSDVNKESRVAVGPEIMGYAPLHFAARRGFVEMCALLLASGANVQRRTADDFSFTALHLASAHGHLETVETLLDGGANINSLDWNGVTPLMGAYWNSRAEITQLLITSGARIDIASHRGTTILHLSVKRNDLEMCTMAIASGTDVNQQEDEMAGGSTALHFACAREFLDIVVYLIEEANANWHLTNYYGDAPLQTAGRYNQAEVVGYLERLI